MPIRASREHGIISIATSQLTVTTHRTGQPNEPDRLRINNRDIGYAQADCNYPESVTLLVITLTEHGRSLRSRASFMPNNDISLASHSLPYRRLKDDFAYYASMRSFVRTIGGSFIRGAATTRIPAQAVDASVALETCTYCAVRELAEFYTPPEYPKFAWQVDPLRTVELDYEYVAALTPPVTLFQEIEHTFFRSAESEMTNLNITFPPVRPHGRDEWYRNHSIAFAQEIKSENWLTMLQAIEGAFYEEINSSERLRRRIHGTSFPGTRDIPPGQCIDRSLFDQDPEVEVCIGNRLIHNGRCRGTVLYLVDGPNYGVGLYIFTDQASARDWANGRMTFQEARRRGTFIPHGPQWLEHAREAISRLATA